MWSLEFLFHKNKIDDFFNSKKKNLSVSIQKPSQLTNLRNDDNIYLALSSPTKVINIFRFYVFNLTPKKSLPDKSYDPAKLQISEKNKYSVQHIT